MIEDSIIHNIRPTKAKVLVIPILEDAKKGSLLLTTQKVEYYKVIATGPLCEHVKAGDTVLLDHGARNSYRTDEYMITDEAYISAIRLPE